MAPNFAADIRRWATPADLVTHLSHYDPAIAPWAKGVTLHHTYTPQIKDWRGVKTVYGTRNYYRDTKEWEAGPHLFICVGAPDPDDDGIFQLTPLNLPGIHAGKCNSDHWGIEIVGRYDDTPWSPKLADFVYGTVLALLHWRKLGPEVKGHRECLNNKSCPGKAINMDKVRAEVERRLELGL